MKKSQTKLYRYAPESMGMDARYHSNLVIARRLAKTMANEYGERVSIHRCVVETGLRKPDLYCAMLNGDSAWCSTIEFIGWVKPSRRSAAAGALTAEGSTEFTLEEGELPPPSWEIE